MMYVDSSALVAIELMALKATVEPMLIRERSVVKRNVSKTELSGIFQPGLTCFNLDKLHVSRNNAQCVTREHCKFEKEHTCAMNEENGNPLSRAKDHVCRDTVASVLITDDVTVTIRMAVMMDAPA